MVTIDWLALLIILLVTAGLSNEEAKELLRRLIIALGRRLDQ